MESYAIYRTRTALTDDTLKQLAPSIFADTPYPGISDRYAFIPTIKIVNRLRDKGWMPVRAAETHTTVKERVGYTKHMLRFRLREAPLLVGDVVPEIILVNAHDGGAAYQMMLGLYRLLCENGLVVGQGCFDRVSVRHTGNISGEILEAAQRIINEAHSIAPAIRQMRDLQLTDSHKMTFATAALKLRFGRDERTGFPLSPISANQILEPRREADQGDDLWTILNVVQENLIKGGMVGQSLCLFSRRVVTRPVVSVPNDIRLNRGLWTLAHDMTGVSGNREHGRGRVIIRKRATAVEPAQR